MAIRPDFQTGTITLVASSANFTTVGPSLQVAGVQAGDAVLTPSGHTLIISAVTGANSGTLFLPCPDGAAGTALALRIRYQPDGSRYQGATRDLLDRLSQGLLDGIANMPNGVTGQVISVDATGQPTWVDNVGYAEGLWTPSINFGELSAGQAYTEQTGTYIRVGSLVFCKFRVTFSNKGTSTGNSNLQGLPFYISEDGFGGVVSIGFYSNMALATPGINGFLSTGTSFALRTLSTTGSSQVTNAHFTNTSSIIGGLVYKAAS